MEEEDTPGLVTGDASSWPLPSPIKEGKKQKVQEVRFSSEGSGGDSENASDPAEFQVLPPRVTDVSLTSLHSFLLPKKGSKSRLKGTPGSVRKTNLADIDGGRSDKSRDDRSRSPVPSGSSEDQAAPSDASSHASASTVRFGATRPTQDIA